MQINEQLKDTVRVMPENSLYHKFPFFFSGTVVYWGKYDE